MFEFDDTGRLIKEFSPLLRLAVQDLFDLPLTDQGIAFLADTRVVKKLLDITHPAGSPVDQIFTLAGAVQTPGHGDFLIGNRKRVVRIVHGDCHIGIAHGLPGLRSGKYNVLHGSAAQGLGALLAEYPADRIRDIALPRPVRAHHACYSVMKLEQNLVRKGFEALYFKTFQIHILTPGITRS